MPLTRTFPSATVTLSSYPVLVAQEEQTSGTNGGTASLSAWTTRVLNTLVYNGISGASLSSNQITLPTGTYWITATSPYYASSTPTGHQCRIYNVSDSAVVAHALGTSEYGTGSNGSGKSHIMGTVFTLSATKIIRLEYYQTGNSSSNSLGVAVSTGTNEVYGQVCVEQISPISLTVTGITNNTTFLENQVFD